MRHGCDRVATFLRSQIGYQGTSFFLDGLDNRIELFLTGKHRHCVLFLNDD